MICNYLLYYSFTLKCIIESKQVIYLLNTKQYCVLSKREFDWKHVIFNSSQRLQTNVVRISNFLLFWNITFRGINIQALSKTRKLWGVLHKWIDYFTVRIVWLAHKWIYKDTVYWIDWFKKIFLKIKCTLMYVVLMVRLFGRRTIWFLEFLHDKLLFYFPTPSSTNRQPLQSVNVWTALGATATVIPATTRIHRP